MVDTSANREPEQYISKQKHHRQLLFSTKSSKHVHTDRFLQVICAEENQENSLLLAHGAGRIKTLFKILALKSSHDFARAFPRDKHKRHFSDRS